MLLPSNIHIRHHNIPGDLFPLPNVFLFILSPSSIFSLLVFTPVPRPPNNKNRVMFTWVSCSIAVIPNCWRLYVVAIKKCRDCPSEALPTSDVLFNVSHDNQLEVCYNYSLCTCLHRTSTVCIWNSKLILTIICSVTLMCQGVDSTILTHQALDVLSSPAARLPSST